MNATTVDEAKGRIYDRLPRRNLPLL